MKILCDRQQLSEAFGVVAAITPLKTPKPIAKNVMLLAENDSLTFSATDFEMSAQLRIDSVKVKEPGAVTVQVGERSTRSCFGVDVLHDALMIAQSTKQSRAIPKSNRLEIPVPGPMV